MDWICKLVKLSFRFEITAECRLDTKYNVNVGDGEKRKEEPDRNPTIHRCIVQIDYQSTCR